MSRASNYNRSNAITAIDFAVSGTARGIARQLLEGSAETGHRQLLAQELCDALCDCAAIDIVGRVTISDASQWHKKRSGRTVFKQYGFYRPASRYVYINNRTAVRGQLLAAKTFLDTLLHEWMHHYDLVRLGLDSIHTSGFYARLRLLRESMGLASEDRH